MGAGKNHLRRKASSRALAVVPQPTGDDLPRSLFGQDTPIATVIKWRGELWGDLAWGDVVAIMQNAEKTGATETWARLTRRMYQDGHILAMRGTRLDPVSGADFDVAPGGPSEIDALAARDVEEMMRSLPDLPAILDAILDAVFVGWSVNEIIWDARGAWVWPEAIHAVEPHRLRFTQTIEPYLWDDGRLGNDPGAIANIGLLGKPLRENKYVVHMPRVIPDYAIASGLLRACVRYWWPKWESVKAWLQGAEVAGNPRAIAKFPTSTADNVREAMFSQIQNLPATGAIVTDKDVDVEILQVAAQGTGSVWDGLTTWCDNGITKTVLGSTLNVDAGDAGSRALGESQGGYTIDPRLKKDSAAMWSTWRRDLVRPFLEFNLWRYGGRMPALPVITSRFAEELEPQFDPALLDAEAISVDELRKAFGHKAIGGPRGEAVAKRAAQGFGGAFTGGAGGLAATPSNTDYLSAGGAPAASPFPWELVDRMSREAE